MNFWVNDIFAIEALKAKRISDKNLRIFYGLQTSDEVKKENRKVKKMLKEQAESKSKEEREIKKANKVAAKAEAKRVSHLPLPVWDITASRELVAMLKNYSKEE